MGRSRDGGGECVLEVAGLAGGYGDLQIFSEVSFSVARGQVLGITGANGVGKTTLMSTLVGLLPASAGRVKLSGNDLTDMPTHDRLKAGLALVPEGRQMLSGLTVQDNLELALGCRGNRHAGTKKADYEHILSVFPRLRSRLSQPSGSLSGGEQQMLANARAILSRPDALLLDEPTQGLAPVIVDQVVETLRQLTGQMAIVVVEQNVPVLRRFAEEVVFMSHGRLQW